MMTAAAQKRAMLQSPWSAKLTDTTPLDLSALDLFSDPRAIWAFKKPVAVPVHFAPTAGSLHTLEGHVDYPAGAAICTGVRGEQWPVGRRRFLKLYEPMPGTTKGRDGCYRKKKILVRAKQIRSQAFLVRVSRKRLLITGQPGDWIVQYSPRKRSVVAQSIFQLTYAKSRQAKSGAVKRKRPSRKAHV